MRYTQYIKVEVNRAGRCIVTVGVDRNQLNYNSHGKMIARYRVVTTDKASFLYSARENEAHTPYFPQVKG